MLWKVEFTVKEIIDILWYHVSFHTINDIKGDKLQDFGQIFGWFVVISENLLVKIFFYLFYYHLETVIVNLACSGK